MEKFAIDTPFIPLAALLKLLNLAESGGMAKMAIEEGRIKVNGETETRKRKKITRGDIVCIDEYCVEIV